MDLSWVCDAQRCRFLLEPVSGITTRACQTLVCCTVMTHKAYLNCHMRRPENATVTAYCMDLLGAELRPLKQAEAAGRLVPQVGMP